MLLIWSRGFVNADRIHIVRSALTKAPARFSIFGDAWDTKDFDPGWRRALVEVFTEYYKSGQLAAVHILGQSKMVRMGLSVANLALRMAGIKLEIKAHGSRDTFNAAMSAARIGKET